MKNLSLKITVFVLSLATCKPALAQKKQFINPDSLPPISKSYTQAIKVSSGNIIYMAGQAPVNAKKKL